MNRHHSLVFLVTIILQATVAGSGTAIADDPETGNYTPGDAVGNDHSAYLFSPFYWQVKGNDNFEGQNNGEHHYLKHAGSGGSVGQQYDQKAFWEKTDPGTQPPVQCNLLTFHNIINMSYSDVGTLYIVTHGGATSIVVEAYEGTPQGLAARNARYQTYLNGEVEDQPTLQPGDITDLWSVPDAYYGIAVTKQFLDREVDMPGALVYLGSCSSANLTTSFTSGENGARVAIGNKFFTKPVENLDRIKRVFKCLDGQFRQPKRVLGTAISPITDVVTVTGKQNTTLAPSVYLNSFADVECPEVGDTIDIKFDTGCDGNTLPDLDTDCCKWSVEWIDEFTLRATLTQDDQTLDYVSLEIDWNTLKSARNEARLDGNRVPRPNAKGRAHDNFTRKIRCDRTCEGDVTGDDTVNIEDLLGIIGSWGSSNDDQTGDGVTDISDLLLVLDVFGTTCVGGNCCLGEYCLDDVSETTCVDIEGLWDAEHVICQVQECLVEGICCFVTSCDATLEPEECEFNGGTFFEGYESCLDTICIPAPGSCCIGVADCISDVLQSECERQGGIFTGEIPCDSGFCEPFDIPGACCLDDETCSETVSPECELAGGTWQGDYTTCSMTTCGSTGACCVDVPGTPSCLDAVTEEMCQDSGGTFYLDTTCTDLYASGDCQEDVGACCVEESCSQLTEPECIKKGGVFTPDTTCEEMDCMVGACCLGDSCIDDTTESNCNSMGGMFFMGATCDEIPCF